MFTIPTNNIKKNFYDIRFERQKEINLIINQCQELCIKHKEIFENQFNSCSKIEKTLLKKEEIISQNNDVLIDEEISEFFCESSSIFLDSQILNKRLISPRKKCTQRCVSVSTVTSIDKRKNKVYEKWPDYNQISQIVGYRIKKKSPSPPPQPLPAPLVRENTSKKGKKSLKFVKVARQIKDLSIVEKDLIKNQPINIKPKENKSILPTMLCPSSKIYSKHIQTRQWLMKNCFLCQNLPLI